MNLYHYYDKRSGPFKSLTALSNEEILGIIEKYGLPQEGNADGAYGPERYI